MEHVMIENIQLGFAVTIVLLVPILFSIERIPLEISSFGSLALMSLFFYFFPIYGPNHHNLLSISHIFSGFASQALLAVVSLMIISEGLSSTGIIVDFVIFQLYAKMKKRFKNIFYAFLLIIVLIFSSILNNIPVVILFIPLIISIMTKMKKNPDHYLLSISYMAILGGNLTLIGSSTNVLVSTMFTDFGTSSGMHVPPLSFFSLTPIGLFIAFFGSIYCIFILPKLLRSKNHRKTTNNTNIEVEEKKFIVIIEFLEHSKYMGEYFEGSILNSILGIDASIPLLTIKQKKKYIYKNFNQVLINKKTEFVIMLTRDQIQSAMSNANIQCISNTHQKLSQGYIENQGLEDKDLDDKIMTEVMVHPDSKLIGSSTWNTSIPKNFGLNIVGMEISTQPNKSQLEQYKLKSGDILLVTGPKTLIYTLQHSIDLIPMVLSEESIPNTHHRKRALGILFGVIFLAMTNIMPIALVAFIGALLMFTFKILTIERGMQVVDIKVVGLIVSSIAIGLILEKTGLAHIFATYLSAHLSHFPPFLSLIFFFVLIMIITNLLSNQATAIIFTPIGLSLGQNLHISNSLIIISVIIAANTSFLTPFGYQTNILVKHAGGYSFKQFIKFGSPLALIVLFCYSIYIFFALY